MICPILGISCLKKNCQQYEAKSYTRRCKLESLRENMIKFLDLADMIRYLSSLKFF